MALARCRQLYTVSAALLLLLLQIYIVSAALDDTSEPNFNKINLVIYRKDTRISGSDIRVYQIRKDLRREERGFKRVTGDDNYSEGEVGLVRTYESHYGATWKWGTRILGDYIKWGGYTTRLHVCEVNHRDGLRADVLWKSDCSSIMEFSPHVITSVTSKRGDYFVSDEYREHERPHRFISFLCKHPSSGMLYSVVSSSQRDMCQQAGDERIDAGTFEFYAFAGDLMCSTLPNPENGNIIAGVRRHDVIDTRVRYSCHTGYKLEGEAGAFCHNGRWTPNTRHNTCSLVNCGAPPAVANGVFAGDSYLYGRTVSLHCDSGFEADDYVQHRTCQHNAYWSHNAVRCRRRSCGIPNTPFNGQVIPISVNAEDGTMIEHYTFGSYVEFRCNSGYRLDGESSAQCGALGSWSAEPPFCTKIMCEAMGHPRNGRREGNNFDVGSSIHFSCHQGYVLTGRDILTCLQEDNTGVWDHDRPTCADHVCDEPVAPRDGAVHGEQYTYGSEIEYTCNAGFRLQGANHATCRTDGWDAEQPSCIGIVCSDPEPVLHASRAGDVFVYGAHVIYTCDAGYIISGTNTLTCLHTGFWSHRTPRCTAVACASLPPLQHGTRTGGLLQFGVSVTFKCFPGYELEGEAVTSCNSDKQWTNPMPRCRPCARNTYKAGMNLTSCLPCPQFSVTLVEASSTEQHCICERGRDLVKTTTGQLACQIMQCRALHIPEHGRLLDGCTREYGGECMFACDAGYVRRGSRSTNCGTRGWSVPEPYCQACPVNTYSGGADSMTCHPCPRNSHSQGVPGIWREDCVCRPGYQLTGGQCTDVDECLSENGGCEQVCSNSAGSFHCHCSRPGYELNPDQQTCYPARSCPTQPQPPMYGSLRCNENEAENSQMCFIGCMKGYFFVSGENDYVTCGPATDFQWSHRLVNSTATLPACTKEFFVDSQLPLQFEYRSAVSCNDVMRDSDLVTEHITSYIQALSECAGRCTVPHINATCRDQNNTSRFHVHFQLLFRNMNENEVGSACDSGCRQGNMRKVLQDTFAVKTAIEDQVAKAEESQLEIYNLDLDPESFLMGNLVLMCQLQGHVLTRNRLCVACAAGYYLPARTHTYCTACPAGTYQQQPGHTTCTLCPHDSTTLTAGSTHVTQCSVRISPVPGFPHEEETTDQYPESSNGTEYMSLDGQPQDVEEFIEDALAFLK